VLLDYDFDPNPLDHQGVSPLNRMTEIVSSILPQRYDADDEYLAPYLQGMELILEAGADPFTDLAFNNTPWQVAKDKNYVACTKLFSKYSIKKAVQLVKLSQ
jgi:hypothetical protein